MPLGEEADRPPSASVGRYFRFSVVDEDPRALSLKDRIAGIPREIEREAEDGRERGVG
ncbi:MAG: hypothetical protein QXL32_05460 [Candidatus Bathyarchaeia archaeon]